MTILRPKVIVAVTMLVTIAFMGCIKPDPSFQSPLGTVPKITVDFVDNVTKVYVKALTDFRYSNISIRVFQGNKTYYNLGENNTYIIHATIPQKEFTLNTTATDASGNNVRLYALQGNFTVRPASDPNVLLQISIDNPGGTPRNYKVQNADLPWSTLADRIE